MIISILQKNKFTRNLIYRLGEKRIEKIYFQIKNDIFKRDKILDFGTGLGNMSELLINKGYDITSLDIQNLSFTDQINPIIFNGKKIPFNSNSFDISLIIFILHHTKNPEKILQEVFRVSKKIILIEDIYNNKINKYITFFLDSLLNLEFQNHPHSNKTDIEWQELFKKYQFKIRKIKYIKSHFFLQHAIYFLEK